MRLSNMMLSVGSPWYCSCISHNPTFLNPDLSADPRPDACVEAPLRKPAGGAVGGNPGPPPTTTSRSGVALPLPALPRLLMLVVLAWRA
jgi:hypothetical protein